MNISSKWKEMKYDDDYVKWMNELDKNGSDCNKSFICSFFPLLLSFFTHTYSFHAYLYGGILRSLDTDTEKVINI
jgi:hypothetical protein